MPLPSDASTWGDWVFSGIGVVVAVAVTTLMRLGYNSKPSSTQATLAGAVVDNRALDPLITAIDRNTKVQEQILARMKSDEERRNILHDLKHERQIDELLHELEKIKSGAKN